MGSVFSPLGGEGAFLPATAAPRQQGHLVQVGRWMPCGHARRVLEDLLGVDVSPEAARRLCEDVGTQVEEKPTAEAQQPWKEEANVPEDLSRMAISAHGAMRGGAWAGVRTRALGAVLVGTADAEKVHVGDLSSVSCLTDAASFPDLVDVETRRCHLIQANEVCAVMDGAEWLPACAVRLLDVPTPLSIVRRCRRF